MKVALSGATGFVGSHVLTELLEHGHEVTALVRNEDQVDIVTARGAKPAVVDLYDRSAVVSLLSEADGAIHTASPGDETSENVDSAVVDAAIEGFAGTRRPHPHQRPVDLRRERFDQRGVAIEAAGHGSMEGADRAPDLDASDVRGVVIVSSVAYGDGGGGNPGSFSTPPETTPAT